MLVVRSLHPWNFNGVPHTRSEEGSTESLDVLTKRYNTPPSSPSRELPELLTGTYIVVVTYTDVVADGKDTSEGDGVASATTPYPKDEQLPV